jgi:hypothetical protein
MPLRVCRRRAPPPLLATLGFLALAACTSTGDFGRLQQPLVTDDIHAWIGEEAARSVGAPVSGNNLTDDERTLRDLAFPLIEPPYDRLRWDAIVFEYGSNKFFDRRYWPMDQTSYYRHLQDALLRSSTTRYNQLIDDIRNDLVRVQPFFIAAHRVFDLDRRRAASMQLVADLSPPERLSALARIGENNLTIAWVEHSLNERCASYRFALEHLAVAEPEPVAATADRLLTALRQAIDANRVVVPAPHFAAVPIAVAARQTRQTIAAK